jgi:hypothetical protein
MKPPTQKDEKESAFKLVLGANESIAVFSSKKEPCILGENHLSRAAIRLELANYFVGAAAKHFRRTFQFLWFACGYFQGFLTSRAIASMIRLWGRLGSQLRLRRNESSLWKQD